jgi:hypothetical protein
MREMERRGERERERREREERERENVERPNNTYVTSSKRNRRNPRTATGIFLSSGICK